MQRIRRASENILGSTVRLSRKKSMMSTPLLTFILTYQKVHCAVRCDATVRISLACIRIESTDGNFGTHEKVAIAIPIVTCTLPIPIPIFGIFVFPFPLGSHRNPMGMGIPFPCTSLIETAAGNGMCTVLLALDISAAFDAVSHAILCKRIESDFGVMVRHLAG